MQSKILALVGGWKIKKNTHNCYGLSSLLPSPSYVVPSSLSHSIKLINPMFRGYAQQVSRFPLLR